MIFQTGLHSQSITLSQQLQNLLNPNLKVFNTNNKIIADLNLNLSEFRRLLAIFLYKMIFQFCVDTARLSYPWLHTSLKNTLKITALNV